MRWLAGATGTRPAPCAGMTRFLIALALLVPAVAGAQRPLADVQARLAPALREAGARHDDARRRALADSIDFEAAVHVVGLLQADEGATPALDTAVTFLAWADSAAPRTPLRTMLRRLSLAYRAYGLAGAPAAISCTAASAAAADLRTAGALPVPEGTRSPIADAASQYETLARQRLGRPALASCGGAAR